MDQISEMKKLAAERAIEYIKEGMVIGLGSGSTSAFAIRKLAELIQNGQFKNIKCIPSSVQTAKDAQELHIPISTLDDNPRIDINIDGADEVDSALNLIKGGGGALLREKILAQASDQFLVIVDSNKISRFLGMKWSVPIEVLPFALQVEKLFLESLGAEVKLRKTQEGTIFKTDQGNLILDANFGEIKDPISLADKLDQRAGIMEHGIFINLASEIIVGSENGIQHIKRG